MDWQTTLILFWSVIALIFIIIITIYILQNRKWKIIINPTKNNFTYGENIIWNFDLIAKKNIIWNWIYCELLWYNTVYKNDNNWWHNYEDVLIYSSEIEIESAKDYLAEHQGTYNFSIPAPSEVPSTVPKTNNFLNWIINLKSMSTWRNIKRYIKITLDAKWLDISKRKKIFIN